MKEGKKNQGSHPVRIAGILVLVLLGLGMIGCSRDERPTLYVYNWSDYIDQEVVEAFEKAENLRVVMDYFDSNESMYAKINAGASGYDVVFPTSYMVSIMREQGLIAPIQRNLIPNLVNLDPKYLEFAAQPALTYSVPYMISTTGIGWLESQVGRDFVPSWSVFGDPRFRGRMTMLNDMRETIGAALKFLGYSMNTTNPAQLQAAQDLLLRWKPNLAKFEAEAYKNGLVSGEFRVVHGYNGDIYQVMEENDDIRFGIPLEGTTISVDEMVILESSTNKELAHRFINFLLDGQIAAQNTNYVYFLSPNIAGYPLMDEEILEDPAIFLSDEILAKSEALLDLGENNQLYIRVWDVVRAGM
jgi:spermidine/putrescine transport system substrate-binding protein